jgi:hypothetical protein
VCKERDVKGKELDKSKGYGFVVFSDEVSAELACTVGKQSGQRIWRVRRRAHVRTMRGVFSAGGGAAGSATPSRRGSACMRAGERRSRLQRRRPT